MRLIDADKLHYSRIRIAHSDGTIGGYNAVVMSAEIKDAPTVDAVSIDEMERIIAERCAGAVIPVRCKDCKYHIDEEPGMVYCPEIVGGWVKNDWYCADGERRTE